MIVSGWEEGDSRQRIGDNLSVVGELEGWLLISPSCVIHAPTNLIRLSSPFTECYRNQ